MTAEAADGTAPRGQSEQAEPNPIVLERLLRRCAKIAPTNPQGALALARLLHRSYPDDVRVQQVIMVLEARLAASLRPVQLTAPPAHPTPPPYTPPPIHTIPIPPTPKRHGMAGIALVARRRQPSFWQLLVIGSVIVALLGVAITNGALPNLSLSSDSRRTVSDLFNPAPTALLLPTLSVPPVPPALPPTPAPPYQPTPMPIGKVQTYGLWQGTVTLPEHVAWLDEPLADVPPQGRLLVAVMTISNLTGEARPIPPDLFVLVDAQLNFYRPLAGASTRLLEQYGRGTVGDLALEEAIPGGGTLVSVPLVFDVPAEQGGFVLVMGEFADTGWQLQP